MSAEGSSTYVAFGEMSPLAPGVAPTAPNLHKMNIIDFIATGSPDFVQSTTMRSDRKTSNFRIDDKTIMCSVNYNMHNYASGADEPLLKSVLFSGDWSDIHSTGASVDVEGAVITASGSTINFTAATTVPDNITDYQKIRIVGSANNDGVYSLVNTTGDTYTASPTFTADETLGVGVLVQGRMIRDDATYLPLMAEKGLTGSDEYYSFLGLVCNTLNMTLPENGIITSSAELVGLTDIEVTSTSYPDATYTNTDAANTEFSASVDTILYLDDVLQTNICHFRTMSIALANGIETLTGLGKFGACKTTSGQFGATIGLTLWYKDSDIVDKMVAGTKISVAVVLDDDSGAAMSITFPQLKIISETAPVSTVGDLEQTISCDAETSTASGNKMQIDQFPAY
jgi:hypothetical protein